MHFMILVVCMAICVFFICFMAGADPRRKWPDVGDMLDEEQELEIWKWRNKSERENKNS